MTRHTSTAACMQRKRIPDSTCAHTQTYLQSVASQTQHRQIWIFTWLNDEIIKPMDLSFVFRSNCVQSQQIQLAIWTWCQRKLYCLHSNEQMTITLRYTMVECSYHAKNYLFIFSFITYFYTATLLNVPCNEIYKKKCETWISFRTALMKTKW